MHARNYHTQNACTRCFCGGDPRNQNSGNAPIADPTGFVTAPLKQSGVRSHQPRRRSRTVVAASTCVQCSASCGRDGFLSVDQSSVAAPTSRRRLSADGTSGRTFPRWAVWQGVRAAPPPDPVADHGRRSTRRSYRHPSGSCFIRRRATTESPRPDGRRPPK